MTGKTLTRNKYDAAAIDRAIAASRQKITRREARLIHALLRGPDHAATVEDFQEAQP